MIAQKDLQIAQQAQDFKHKISQMESQVNDFISEQHQKSTSEKQELNQRIIELSSDLEKQK